ncbi:hypothetical protein ACFQVA_19005 [Actinomadura keratinilytica]
MTDWGEVGADRSLPIVLVGRGAASGTRDVLQRRLLDGAFEPPASSRDCSRKDNPKASVIRCELDTTDQVIATVARVPGALGYSELRTTSTLEGVRRLSLDGRRPRWTAPATTRTRTGRSSTRTPTGVRRRLPGRRFPRLRHARARAGRGAHPRASAVRDARGVAGLRGGRLRRGRREFTCRRAPGTPRRSGTGPGSS